MKKAAVQELSSSQVRRRCSLSNMALPARGESAPFIGQSRAVDAMEFGMGVAATGYNAFVVGLPGTGRTSYVLSSLKERAAAMETPQDWVYVYNFEDPSVPVAISLPSGQGRLLESECAAMLEEVKTAIANAFERATYEEAKAQKINAFQENIAKTMSAISDEAEKRGFAVKRTPQGFVNVPLKKTTDETGAEKKEEISSDEYEKLPESEKKRLKDISDAITSRTLQALRRIREKERQLKSSITSMEEDICRGAITPYFDELLEKFPHCPRLAAWLETMKANVVSNFGAFVAAARDDSADVDFSIYKINVLVSHEKNDGAPVVWETNPTYYNLAGKLEYELRQGYYNTDFTHIVAGAIHRANGGFLVLEAEQLLRNFMSYDLLKRVLRSGKLQIESLGEQYSAAPVASPRPEAIPIKLRVVLIGNHELYYLLQEYDPEFQKLFKLVAEFDYEIDRTEQSEADVARLIVIKARESGLLPFDRSGLEELVDYAARLSGDQNKLSLQFNKLFELVVESSAWAKKAGSKKVYRRQVIHAFDEKRRRSALLEEKIRGGFMENLVRIDTTGEAVGQINGLAVVSFADVAFGHPSRITANTFMGPGGVVNIERETNMAGPIHNKGVLTLSSYFGRIYAQKMPINFTARIAFEQQYGGIDGDSASSTELYCLLSSLADLPIRQEVAVTGSVDQLGNVQPIGGVNEKIEGFFDYCQAKGLTGSQGVMIPWQNEQHLMLSHRVADAISKGIFHVWTVQTIDEGIELLTGVPAGSPDSRGNYPASSVHGRVFARLKEWHKQALKLAGGSSHPAAKKKGTKNARRGRAE